MDELWLADKVVELANDVCDRCGQVKAYREACRVLGEEAKQVGKVVDECFLKGDGARRRKWGGNDQVGSRLEGLKLPLESARELSGMFSEMGTALKLDLAKNYASSFRKVCWELQRGLQTLSLLAGFPRRKNFQQELEVALQKDAKLTVHRIDQLDDDSLKRQLDGMHEALRDLSLAAPVSSTTRRRRQEAWFVEPEQMTYDLEDGSRVIIGDGTFGTVYRGRMRNLSVGVEEMPDASLQETTELRGAVEVMYALTHPNVIQTRGGFYPVEGEKQHADLPPFIVTEPCERDSLAKHLSCGDEKMGVDLNERELVRILKEAADGLSFLQRQNFEHLNVRPENILLDGALHATICGFEVAKSTQRSNGKRTRSQDGANRYQAPEAVQGSKYSPSRDVWSFGVVLYELICGKLDPNSVVGPSGASGLYLSELSRASRAEFPQELRTLTKQCLQKEPSNRPRMEVVAQELERVLDTMDQRHNLIGEGAGGSLIDGAETFQCEAPRMEHGDIDEERRRLVYEDAIAGKVGAMRAYGTMLLEGSSGVERNEEKGFKWIEASAVRGDLDAQVKLAGCFRSGTGVRRNEYCAILWYRHAAEQGFVEAQYRLGLCYYDGGVVMKPDTPEAVLWFRKAAEEGHSKAQFQLGLCYHDGDDGVEKPDAAEAVKWYRMAAEQGNADAQFNLGMCFLQGTAVKQDAVEAARWYRMAADQGHPHGQYNLGVCYQQGEGVKPDVIKAVQWYRTAAENGSPEAQYNMGLAHESGLVVKKDAAEAAKWYRRAAKQGDWNAQFNLGVSYMKGRGVKQDEAEGVRWYRMAAVQGFPMAQMKLGVCYWLGNGVEINLTEAKKWMGKAAAQGEKRAQKALVLLMQDMNR